MPKHTKQERTKVSRKHKRDPAGIEQEKFRLQVGKANDAAKKGDIAAVRAIARIAGKGGFPEGTKFILDRSLAKAQRRKASTNKVQKLIRPKGKKL